MTEYDSSQPAPRLGVNIDHVATLRNARGGAHPDPARAAVAAMRAGADGITAHLREDRRHIMDADLPRIMDAVSLPLNLEIAATEEMVAIAMRLRPHAVCLVPERRLERTTEGGLEVAGAVAHLSEVVPRLAGAGIRVSLFIAPDPPQIEAAGRVGAAVVEFHTGTYADAEGADRVEQFRRLADGAQRAADIGLEVHAGHGLNFDNVGPVAGIPQVMELNIGHFLVGEGLFIGLEASIRTMHAAIRRGRLEGRASR